MGLTAKKVYAVLNGKIEKVSSDVASLGAVLFYAGSVPNESFLPSSPKVGAVYNIDQDSIYGSGGMNVAWNGSFWDPLGVSFDKTEMAEQIKNQVKDYVLNNPPSPQVLSLENDGTLVLKVGV